MQIGVVYGTGYAVTGNTAVNAGSYTALLVLNEGYAWSDGTKESKTVPWSITRAVLTAAYAGETISKGTVPVLETDVYGFVNGEDADTAAGYSAPYISDPPSEPGSYVLTPSGGYADNYSFVYESGILTIENPDVPEPGGKIIGILFAAVIAAVVAFIMHLIFRF